MSGADTILRGVRFREEGAHEGRSWEGLPEGHPRPPHPGESSLPLLEDQPPLDTLDPHPAPQASGTTGERGLWGQCERACLRFSFSLSKADTPVPAGSCQRRCGPCTVTHTPMPPGSRNPGPPRAPALTAASHPSSCSPSLGLNRSFLLSLVSSSSLSWATRANTKLSQGHRDAPSQVFL